MGERGVILDPEITDYDENGVDLTLIRWWQSLTPVEKLKYIDSYNASLAPMLERNASA